MGFLQAELHSCVWEKGVGGMKKDQESEKEDLHASACRIRSWRGAERAHHSLRLH